MIDTNLIFIDFDRNTATDPFFNSNCLAAEIIKSAISNDFTVKYNNKTVIELGFYSQDDYNITYPGQKERISIRTNRVKFVDYLFLENSDFEYYKGKKKNNDNFLDSWLLTDYFFENHNLPKNKDSYIIWRTEIYIDRELYKTYDQTIRFVYEG